MNPRELDALIDQKFFDKVRFMPDKRIYLGPAEDPCPFYSKDNAAAVRLIAKLYEVGYLTTIEQILQPIPGQPLAYRCQLRAYKMSRISENTGYSYICSVAATLPEAVVQSAFVAIKFNAQGGVSVQTDPKTTDSKLSI